MKNRQFKNLAENVYLSEDGKSVVIIDQRKLPNSLEVLTLSTAKEMYDAIKSLAVRGAPAIGICAGYSIYCLARLPAPAGVRRCTIHTRISPPNTRFTAQKVSRFVKIPTRLTIPKYYAESGVVRLMALRVTEMLLPSIPRNLDAVSAVLSS